VSADHSVLVQYYAAVDAGDLDAAMALVDPDVVVAMSLPGATRHTTGRDGLLGYLSGRGDVDRRHIPLRVSVAGDVEFVHGSVLEDGVTTTGHFLGAVSLTHEGLIGRYQVVFDPGFSLVP
jgi:ketosteroid isomerase-like protein